MIEVLAQCADGSAIPVALEVLDVQVSDKMSRLLVRIGLLMVKASASVELAR